MEPQESISFSIDTTSDSINVTKPTGRLAAQPNSSTLLHQYDSDSIAGDEMTKIPPDKMMIVTDKIPSPSGSSSSPNLHNQTNQKNITYGNELSKKGKTRKSVLFNTVTIYHFNRSQGFTTIPSQGGSTLGMKRKHFLRRRLSVDLYEEVRRRSRREILLKIRFEKRKQEEQLRREIMAECEELNVVSSNSSSSSNTITSDDDNDSTYSDCSDISDSELESDGYIFLQPIGVKLRRSLLRASGVGRIDPSEKKECNIIRDSRDRSGCKCVGQCIPEYCECTRLGVNCHVDRVSFPCGCVSSGCRNPLGRTEFDIARVRGHFEEIVKTQSSSNSSENDPSNSDYSDEVAIDNNIKDTAGQNIKTEIVFESEMHRDLDRKTCETNQSSVEAH